jgi:hypothetical protein
MREAVPYSPAASEDVAVRCHRTSQVAEDPAEEAEASPLRLVARRFRRAATELGFDQAAVQKAAVAVLQAVVREEALALNSCRALAWLARQPMMAAVQMVAADSVRSSSCSADQRAWKHDLLQLANASRALHPSPCGTHCRYRVPPALPPPQLLHALSSFYAAQPFSTDPHPWLRSQPLPLVSLRLRDAYE